MLRDALLAQRGGLIGWVPVCLSIGIGGYFALRFEPTMLMWCALAALSLALLIAAQVASVALRPVCLGLALVCAGAGLAKLETMRMAAPVLGFRYYGPVEGRIVAIDRSSSDAVRLTLDRVRLDRMDAARTPDRVRISLHGDQPIRDWRPGQVLILTAHLSPPAGPAEPGGFDFRRFAWFEGIGAVGYTRTPVLRLSESAQGWALRIFAVRMAISGAVQAHLPGEVGAFAAAVITGDRSGMGQGSLLALRASNLAHLLAISGLHMGLLTGFIFMIVRSGLSLWPALALRLPVKKIAAVCALIAGAGYLLLSGGNVATERAYIMVAVMLIAVLLDRRALTLRGVALAATLVLVLHPEALTGPGFQMSFAATTALVVVFRLLRGVHMGPRWFRPAASVIISSAVAGAATAPFAAAHFNQISHYGLVANLVSVPLMGVLVMPAAVLAACLAPFGLAGAGLWLMGLGLRWILFVAATVAGWDGALSHVKSPGPWVLTCLTLGLMWLILWQGRARLAGGIGILAAAVLWVQAPRPAILVADSGGIIGVMGPEGRSLSSATGDSFVAGIWLENDGGPVAQDVAASRPGLTAVSRGAGVRLGQHQIMLVRGKTALAQMQGCGGADILISNQTKAGPRPCLLLDVATLRKTGAIAIDQDDAGRLTVTTASQITGRRPWNDSAPVVIAPLDKP
ncbi:ComEC/Rec2 family competence protein [Loktanella salsilacus]|uniref:ComEC/Rec2 family competence protein n=1 Tax=Loktanella salsilacus TaxID=195913 RepID=UPI0037369A7C